MIRVCVKLNTDAVVFPIRTKWKRQSAAGLELLAAAGRMFLPSHFLCPPAPPTMEPYLYQGHAHPTTLPLLPFLLTHTDPR